MKVGSMALAAATLAGLLGETGAEVVAAVGAASAGSGAMSVAAMMKSALVLLT